VNTLLVGYDLHRPGQDYEELTKFLKGQSTWWHALDSTWIVVTSQSASELLAEIKRFIDANDEVLVMDVKGDWWTSLNLPKEATDWLQKYV
jgi:hypothetical protein